MHEETPEFQPVDKSARFRFRCHPGVGCFTECCRELDLALTPYDALRLKQALGIDSATLLERYVIISWEEGCLFPVCYLTMVDDGRASCVFVGPEGCSVYADRPGACRAYPVGRGASRGENGATEQQFVLVREPHCQGCLEDGEQTVAEFFHDQGMAQYNRYNDALLELLHHPRVTAGFRPSRTQVDKYLLALYDLDGFRQEFATGRLSLNAPLTPSQLQGIAGSDADLLLLGIRWLMQEYFGE